MSVLLTSLSLIHKSLVHHFTISHFHKCKSSIMDRSISFSFDVAWLIRPVSLFAFILVFLNSQLKIWPTYCFCVYSSRTENAFCFQLQSMRVSFSLRITSGGACFFHSSGFTVKLENVVILSFIIHRNCLRIRGKRRSSLWWLQL